MEKEIIDTAMKNLENMTKSPTQSNDGHRPCDICGKDGEHTEIDGRRGWLCSNVKCYEKAKAKLDLREAELLLQNILSSGIPPKYTEIVTDKKYKNLVQDRGVFISGPAGTGKTVMACSIAVAHIGQGRKTIFKSLPKLVMEIQDSYKSEEYSSYDRLKDLSEVAVLILDDLGAEKMTDFVRQALYFLINEREQWNRTTIITSNYNLEQIGKNLDSRLASRIAGMCAVINLKGKDRRIQQGNQDE